MSVIYIALPASLLLVLLAVIAFVWSVRSGQMDDLETPGVRLLLDDDPGTRRETDEETEQEAGEDGTSPERD